MRPLGNTAGVEELLASNSSRRMYLSVIFRKSTPPKNHQLIVFKLASILPERSVQRRFRAALTALNVPRFHSPPGDW